MLRDCHHIHTHTYTATSPLPRCHHSAHVPSLRCRVKQSKRRQSPWHPNHCGPPANSCHLPPPVHLLLLIALLPNPTPSCHLVTLYPFPPTIPTPRLSFPSSSSSACTPSFPLLHPLLQRCTTCLPLTTSFPLRPRSRPWHTSRLLPPPSYAGSNV